MDETLTSRSSVARFTMNDAGGGEG
jgi:hypothetical protein